MKLRACLSLVLAAVLPAQDRPDPEEQMARKLQSKFLSVAPWLLDFDDALAKSKSREQLVLGYFTTAGP